MKKIIFLVIALVMSVSLYSQWTQSDGHYNGAVAYGFKITIDSTIASYTSPYVDWTTISNQTLYFNFSLVQAHYNYEKRNDTLICILQGKDFWGGVLNIDTLGEGSAGSEKIISGTTIAECFAQSTISQVYYLPEVRLYIAHKNTGTMKNGDKGILYCDIYAKTINTLPNVVKLPWR